MHNPVAQHPLTHEKRNEMVAKNLGLVHHCAKRFVGRGVEYDDLYSAGCVGLIKAVDNFDFSRGLKLSTYAVPLILGEIKRLFRDGCTVKVSRTLKEISLKVARETENFMHTYDRDPTLSELAKCLNLTVEQVAEAISINTPPMSLTTSDEDGFDGQLDLPIDAPQEKLINCMAVQQLLQTLPPRDQQLLQLRYFQRKTQVQTAQILGMTQVQVSRREKKLLMMLRQQL